MTRPSALPAHHRPAGGFRNPWADSNQESALGVVRWMLDRIRRPPPPDPPRGRFERARPAVEVPRAAPDTLTVTWVGHSTVLVQLGGLNILTDPIWAQVAGPLPVAGPRRWVAPGLAIADVPAIDLVLLSHDHYDHFDRAATRRLARAHPGAAWVAPLGLARRLRGLGVGAVHELDWWESSTVAGADGAVTVTAVPAQHFSGRGLTDRNRSLWAGFVVRTGELALFFAGDTALHPEFGRIAAAHGPFDVVLMPIGAYEPRWFMKVVHMDADEAVAAHRALLAAHPDGRRRTRFVPIHWGTFKLTDEPMDEPPRRARAAWEAAGLPADDFWLLRHGETRRDTIAPGHP